MARNTSSPVAGSVREQGATPRQGLSTGTLFGYGSRMVALALLVAVLTCQRWMN